MKLLYAGSVKNVYQDANPDNLWFEFTNDYSVFDWGKMPDPIPGKGEALARLSDYFFNAIGKMETWEKAGLADHPDIAPFLPIEHHYSGMEGSRIQVMRVDVPDLTPHTIGGSLVYDYTFEKKPRQLAPLEVIFRFGVPAGSSLLSRKDWYPFDIYEGAEFEQPLIEFSTKLETRDRMVTYQEAGLILKGDTLALREIHGKTFAVATLLKHLFGEQGLKLWDGKLEWAFIDGKVALVDSIGPDELRVGKGDLVMSKQFLRNFYLGTPWEKQIEEAKKRATAQGRADWKNIATKDLKAEPPPLSQNYLTAAKALYGDFCKMMIEGKESNDFSDAMKNL